MAAPHELENRAGSSRCAMGLATPKEPGDEVRGGKGGSRQHQEPTLLRRAKSYEAVKIRGALSDERLTSTSMSQ